MTSQTVRSEGLVLTIEQHGRWLTISGRSPDEQWTFTDAAGHDHAYPYSATMVVVVDRSHWCDGTEGHFLHDPHEQTDECHLVCGECGETIEPRTHPPGRQVWEPEGRSTEATIDVDHGTVTLWLTEDESTEVVHRLARSDRTGAYDFVRALADLDPTRIRERKMTR